MKYVLIGYNQDFKWALDYTDDYLFYDRSETNDFIKDFPKDKVIKTKNVGNADYDRLSYLVDNYDNLPDVFLWSKANLFKYISKEEFDKVKNANEFVPLLTQNHQTTKFDGTLEYINRHKTNKDVSFYKDGIYHEFNNNWYVDRYWYFSNYADFASEFLLPNPEYIPFAPGGNYILTKERVHRYSRDFYDKMRSILPYCQLPSEAHFCERSYYTIWK